jgi:hypothetical protein
MPVILAICEIQEHDLMLVQDKKCETPSEK